MFRKREREILRVKQERNIYDKKDKSNKDLV